jgi:hypothetical protein
MKLQCVPILAQKESPSVRFSRDEKLLAVTLLLALLSSGLTVLAFSRVAALQADLESLRAELRDSRAQPARPESGAAGPKVSSQQLQLAGPAVPRTQPPPAACP